MAKNLTQRIELLKAMDTLARAKHTSIHLWLSYGVANGDIFPGVEDEDLLDYVDDDETFANLMGLFLETMHDAFHDGGLYCDGVLSKS